MNQHSINTNIHEATHFIHFHLTFVPSTPLPSPPDNAVISTAKKPCEGCHGFKPPSFSAKKVVFWSPDFPLTKTNRFKISAWQWYAMQEAPLESDGLWWDVHVWISDPSIPPGYQTATWQGSCQAGVPAVWDLAWLATLPGGYMAQNGEIRNETCLQHVSCQLLTCCSQSLDLLRLGTFTPQGQKLAWPKPKKRQDANDAFMTRWKQFHWNMDKEDVQLSCHVWRINKQMFNGLLISCFSCANLYEISSNDTSKRLESGSIKWSSICCTVCSRFDCNLKMPQHQKPSQHHHPQ